MPQVQFLSGFHDRLCGLRPDLPVFPRGNIFPLLINRKNFLLSPSCSKIIPSLFAKHYIQRQDLFPNLRFARLGKSRIPGSKRQISDKWDPFAFHKTAGTHSPARSEPPFGDFSFSCIQKEYSSKHPFPLSDSDNGLPFFQ